MDSERNPVSYGTNDANPPVLPIASSGLSIIFQWVALLPLVIYLANSRLSYQLVGQTALAGFIGVSLFPRLGVLDSIADFLQQGADFLDRASSVGELRRTVWDANWGSVFPCANGAVGDILSANALRGVQLVNIPEDVELNQAASAAQNGSNELANPQNTANGTNSTAAQNAAPQPIFRRYQTLHILDCSGPAGPHPPKTPPLGSTGLPAVFEFVVLLGLLGVCAVTVLFGLYGTAVAVLITVFFRIARQLIRIERPSGYLANNEPNATGCMLVALHENASTWYLYKGSRSVVDTLLNKTMIQSITSPLGVWLAYALRVLGILQLVDMTYVAAQMGWDGVALLSLIAVAWVFDSTVYSDERMAALWLRREGVTIQARSFRFGGRTAMIGAIQVLKQNDVTSWMDGILAPSNRRAVWLAKLNGRGSVNAMEAQLSEGDKQWVDMNKQLTDKAVETIIHPAAGAATV